MRAVLKLMLNGGQLIHVLWGENDWGYIDWAARVAGVPICVTIHSCPDSLPEVIRARRQLRKVDAFILMSDTQRPVLESLGVPSSHLHVIHHGIDVDYFKPIEAAPPPVTILSVGSYRRNFELLAKTWARLCKDESLRLRIVAPKVYDTPFRDLPNVQFISGITQDELRAEYWNAACLLMTLEQATANNAILEAMACGVPIVAEDVGGVGEYTRDAAILCPQNDADCLAASVRQIIDDSTIAATLRRRARLRAEELAWPLVRAKTKQLYEALSRSTLHETRVSSHSDIAADS